MPCELVTSESVSDREILFAKYLDGAATPKEIEVLRAEQKAHTVFWKEATQMTLTDVLLLEIFGNHPLEGGIKRRRSHGPRAK